MKVSIRTLAFLAVCAAATIVSQRQAHAIIAEVSAKTASARKAPVVVGDMSLPASTLGPLRRDQPVMIKGIGMTPGAPLPGSPATADGRSEAAPSSVAPASAITAAVEASPIRSILAEEEAQISRAAAGGNAAEASSRLDALFGETAAKNDVFAGPSKSGKSNRGRGSKSRGKGGSSSNRRGGASEGNPPGGGRGAAGASGPNDGSRFILVLRVAALDAEGTLQERVGKFLETIGYEKLQGKEISDYGEEAMVVILVPRGQERAIAKELKAKYSSVIRIAEPDIRYDLLAGQAAADEPTHSVMASVTPPKWATKDPMKYMRKLVGRLKKKYGFLPDARYPTIIDELENPGNYRIIGLVPASQAKAFRADPRFNFTSDDYDDPQVSPMGPEGAPQPERKSKMDEDLQAYFRSHPTANVQISVNTPEIEGIRELPRSERIQRIEDSAAEHSKPILDYLSAEGVTYSRNDFASAIFADGLSKEQADALDIMPSVQSLHWADAEVGVDDPETHSNEAAGYWPEEVRLVLRVSSLPGQGETPVRVQAFLKSVGLQTVRGSSIIASANRSDAVTVLAKVDIGQEAKVAGELTARHPGIVLSAERIPIDTKEKALEDALKRELEAGDLRPNETSQDPVAELMSELKSHGIESQVWSLKKGAEVLKAGGIFVPVPKSEDVAKARAYIESHSKWGDFYRRGKITVFFKPAAEPPLPAVNDGSFVSARYLEVARRQGLAEPLTGFADPRLQNPEVLLAQGWFRDGKFAPVISYSYQVRGETVQEYTYEAEKGPYMIVTFDNRPADDAAKRDEYIFKKSDGTFDYLEGPQSWHPERSVAPVQPAGGVPVHPEILQALRDFERANHDEIMKVPGVVGVRVGRGNDGPGPALVIYKGNTASQRSIESALAAKIPDFKQQPVVFQMTRGVFLRFSLPQGRDLDDFVKNLSLELYGAYGLIRDSGYPPVRGRTGGVDYLIRGHVPVEGYEGLLKDSRVVTTPEGYTTRH